MDITKIINEDSAAYKHGLWIGKYRATAALKRDMPPPPLPEKPAVAGDQLQEWFGLRDGTADSISRFSRGLVKITPPKLRRARKKRDPKPPKSGVEKMQFAGLSPQRLYDKGRIWAMRFATRQLNRGIPPDALNIPIPAGTPEDFKLGAAYGRVVSISKHAALAGPAGPAQAQAPAQQALEVKSAEFVRGRNDGKRLTLRRLAKGELPDRIKLRIPAGAGKDYRAGLDEGKNLAVDEFLNPKKSPALSPEKPRGEPVSYDPESPRYKAEFDEVKAMALELLRAGNLPEEIQLVPPEPGDRASQIYGREHGRAAAIKEYEAELAAKNAPTEYLAPDDTISPIGYNPQSPAFIAAVGQGRADAKDLLGRGHAPEDISMTPYDGGDNNEYCGYYFGMRAAVEEFEAEREAKRLEIAAAFDRESPEYKIAFANSYRIALNALRKGVHAENIRTKSMEELGANRYYGDLHGIAEAKRSFKQEQDGAEIFEQTKAAMRVDAEKKWKGRPRG
ncbi:MAG: hypothetical protein LBL46_03285 [Rickettsiales bacterium]|jgi:hypothetical protein|nr:hypothetical protein [Rickettsiales bacterium]